MVIEKRSSASSIVSKLDRSLSYMVNGKQSVIHKGLGTPLTACSYLKYLYNLSRSCIETKVTAISERVTIMGSHICGAATKWLGFCEGVVGSS